MNHKYYVLIIVIFHIVIASAPIRAASPTRRQGEVTRSDGQTLTGRLSVTPGREPRLFVDHKTRREIPLATISEIRFFPRKESMERQWRFTKMGSEEKEFIGEPFPLRELDATVLLENGQRLSGHLDTLVVYVEAADKNHKIVLNAKDRGLPGQTLEEFVYVTRIRFHEPGRSAAEKFHARFVPDKKAPDGRLPFSKSAEVQPLVRKTLKRLKAERAEDGVDGHYVVDLVMGEELLFAVRDRDKAYVVWPEAGEGVPARGDPEIFARVEAALPEAQDFYDARTLHAVALEPSGASVLSLVSLTRKEVKQFAGMPWRLSVWRWRYNRRTGEVKQPPEKGYFFRIADARKEKPPAVLLAGGLFTVEDSEE